MIALSMGMITRKQLNECLEIQQQSGEPRQLGAIMLARGVLDQEKIGDILAVQKKMGDVTGLPAVKTRGRRLIGEIMVEAAYINEQTLRTALRRQKLLRETGISPRLGELLLAVGELTCNQLQKALALQAMSPRKKTSKGKK